MKIKRYLLQDMADKHAAFTAIDNEYQQAVERKLEWQQQHMYWMAVNDADEEDYPFEYEINQWQLKREIAQKELAEAVKEVSQEVMYAR